MIPALTKGGAEKVVIDLINKSTENGDLITLVLAYDVDKTLLHYKLNSSVKVITIGRNGSKIALYSCLLVWISKNWLWIKQNDVLHCHLTFGTVFGNITWLFRKITKSKLPLIIETNHSVGMPIKTWQKSLFKRSLNCRDGYILIAQSDKWVRLLRKTSVAAYKHIPNGVELPEEKPSNKDILLLLSNYGILRDDKTIIIGSVGRIVSERRPNSIIEIFSKIRELLPSEYTVYFIMGGDGPQMGELKESIRDYQIENIVFLPGLVHEVQKLMSVLDLYITINVGENTGISGLEAAIISLPVISLQVQSDFTPSNSDWIWSNPNTLDVATKAVELIKNKKLIKDMGSKQQQHAIKNYSVDKMFLEYDRFYTKCYNILTTSKIK